MNNDSNNDNNNSNSNNSNSSNNQLQSIQPMTSYVPLEINGQKYLLCKLPDQPFSTLHDPETKQIVGQWNNLGNLLFPTPLPLGNLPLGQAFAPQEPPSGEPTSGPSLCD